MILSKVLEMAINIATLVIEGGGGGEGRGGGGGGGSEGRVTSYI